MTRQYSNLLSTTSSQANDNRFQYDAASRMVRQSWGDGFFVTYEYLTTDEMTAIRENGGLVLASFGYDALGRRTGLARGNGTSTSYGYDAGSQLTGMGLHLGGSASVDYGYGYNPAGQITRRTSSNDAYAWTGAVNVDRGYTMNGLNQYTKSGSVTPTYDGRGNLTQAGGDAYQYNTRNQLFTKGPGTLFYRNPTGVLGQILYNGGGLNLDYVGQELATESGNEAVQRRYVYGPGANEPLVWYEGSGTSDRRYLHADERGSIVAVTDNNGNAIRINTYDEYGIPGGNNLGRFQYTGQKWIPELGMYDYKARMYSPTLGRFLQTDPIGYGDELNVYGYVGGDPVNWRDPSGLFVEGCIGLNCPADPGSDDAGGGEVTVFGNRGFSPFIGGGLVQGSAVFSIPNDFLQQSSLADNLQSTITVTARPKIKLRPGLGLMPQKTNPACTSGRLTLGGQFSATGFLASFGLSGNVEVGVRFQPGYPTLGIRSQAFRYTRGREAWALPGWASSLVPAFRVLAV